jgi:hypothetical protein
MTAPALLALAGLSWPELSLIFFLGLFIAIVVRLVLSRSQRWQRDARMPLDDNTPVDDRTRRTAADRGQDGANHHA